MVFGIISAAVHAAYGAVLGWAAGGWIGLAVGGAVGLALGCFFGWAVAAGNVYSADASGILIFVVDHTWSMLNTVAGALYLTVHFIFGHTLDRNTSAGSCRVCVVEGVSPRYATTIGTVVAGANPTIQRHEDVHVLQARILGPIYLPLVALNYALWTIAPLWLLWHDRANRPISSIGRYFEVGVYPHVWNEAVAYRIQGTPPS
jgi:hypothetical protein